MSGQKIVEGLKDAIAGNFSRVTVEGQVWTRGAPQEERAQALLQDANELIRSFSSICDREGQATNWRDLRDRVRRTLREQHEFMHPGQYTGPRAG
jgi:hypothetical protein